MAVIKLTKPVGYRCPNVPGDVQQVQQRLVEIGKLPYFLYLNQAMLETMLIAGIQAVQKHFMQHPDGVIEVGGTTNRVLNQWSVKPIAAGVHLPGRLREAWDMVNPLLPDGSYCSSGYRSTEDQRKLLHKFYRSDFRAAIVAKYGRPVYDSVLESMDANEDEVLAMVRGVGQLIAKPGTSPHQKMKAIDIGGPGDARQVEVVKMVARANTHLLSGKVLRERNGCVHFELR
jgi:hypothetical protein